MRLCVYGIFQLFLVLCFSVPAIAGDRYFYRKAGKAYYCVRPQAPMEGCYIICNQSNVTRINGFTCVTQQQVDVWLSQVQVTTTKSRQDPCCDPATGSGGCIEPPRVLHSTCHCDDHKTWPISRDPGPLKTVCKPRTFYEAIDEITGTIPVPQLCAEKQEYYDFRGKTLKYPCRDADLSGTECEDCELDDCKGECKVATCEVYQRRIDCKLRCVKCDREGKLLIAIRRRAKSTDPLRADVFIGKVGKVDFPEYPTNLVVLRNRTQAEIRRHLQNNTIDLSAIAASGSSNTDLIAAL